MEEKKPVEYVFNTSIEDIFNSIKKNHSDILRYYVLFISHKGNLDTYVAVNPKLSVLFSSDSAKYDFLFASGEACCHSKIYVKRNRDSVNYYAGFHIHLHSLSINKTQVSITTYEPQIEIRETLLPKLPNLVRYPILRQVEPSTIDEYEILLRIGQALGVKDMPLLKLPDKDIKKGKVVSWKNGKAK